MLIDDGRGKGNKAGVTDENHLLVQAVEMTIEHHVNHVHGLAFSVPFEVTTGGADVCFFYAENSDETDMVLEQVTYAFSGACEVTAYLNQKGTRNAATAITPANLNAGSGKVADGIFEQGADLAGGAATLTGGYLWARLVVLAAIPTTGINFPQDVILPRNATVSFWCDTNAITITGNLSLNYHNADGTQ